MRVLIFIFPGYQVSDDGKKAVMTVGEHPPEEQVISASEAKTELVFVRSKSNEINMVKIIFIILPSGV